MIICYDILSKRTVLINPRFVVSMALGEDATGKFVEIDLAEPYRIKVKENAREIEQIKDFFENMKEK